MKAARRAWLPYRGSFAAFAKAANSRMPADVLTPRLTARRTEKLSALLPDGPR